MCKFSVQKLGVSIVVLSIFFLFTNEIQAASISSNDLSIDNIVNLEKEIGSDALELKASGYNTAIALRTPQKPLGYGSAYVSDNNRYIYVTRGYGDTDFWRYDTVEDKWIDLASLPFGVYYGSNFTLLNNEIYLLFGGFQKSFAKYSISENRWSMLANYPDQAYQGASIESDGTNIYAVSGLGNQAFYKYDVSANEWNPMPAIPGGVRGGADLIHLNGYLYLTRGNSTNTFYRFNLSNNTWASRAVVPAVLSEDLNMTSDGSRYIYVPRMIGTATFYRYDTELDIWSTLVDAPAVARAGAAIYMPDNNIYFFRANGTYDLWKYSISENKFLGIPNMPGSVGLAAHVHYYNNALYVVRGYNTNTIYKYDISTRIWTTLAAAPNTINHEGQSVLANGIIYIFRGNSTPTFYSYNIATDTWSTLTNATVNINTAVLAYPGSGNYLYVARSGGTGVFWRYDISLNTWDDLSVADLPAGVAPNVGASITSVGDNLYLTYGMGISRFFRYTISTNTWSELANLPFSPLYGTDVVDVDSNRIVALAGNNTRELYEYNISANTWRKLPLVQGVGQVDAGVYVGGSITYNNNTFYIIRGNYRAEVLTYTYEPTKYVPNGVYTSNTIDLKYVSSFNSLNVVSDNQGDSYIRVYTRVSDNGIDWDSWQLTTGSSINSSPKRYIQIKIELYSSSDGQISPKVSSYSLDYNTDITAPNTVDLVLGYSKEIDGEVLTSEVTYKHINPYFTWSTPSDSQTEVVGYYVYFGSDINANPINDGYYTTNNYHKVISVMSIGNNYLKIVSVDRLGNTSSVSNPFIYSYEGIGPFIELSKLSSQLNGTSDSTQILNGLRLSNTDTGFWKQEFMRFSPVGLGYGSVNVAYVEDENKVYIAPGMNNNLFYSYDLITNTWTRLADTPGLVYIGGGAVKGSNGFIYMARGNNTGEFWKYNIATNTWDTNISQIPMPTYYGTSFVFDESNYIYMLRGNNTNSFLRYDIQDDSWQTLENTDFGAPSNNYSNLVYIDGSITIDIENKKIYAIQGNYLPGFSVYDIDTNKWTYIGQLPALPYQGGSIEYSSVNNSIYFIPGDGHINMYKYDIENNNWSTISKVPAFFGYGGGLHKIKGDYFFAIRGANNTIVYKYNIKDNSWLLPKRGLFGQEYASSSLLGTSYSADIVYTENDFLYLTRGNYGNDFVRYNQKTGEIKRMASLPMGGYVGATMVYDSVNKKIYYISGLYDNGFYQYDIPTNKWIKISTDNLPSNGNSGASLIFDGNRYIYYMRGGAVNFYRYDTQGNAGSRWSSLANIPASVGYGAELEIVGNTIYTLRAGNSNNFYKYDIATNTWSSLASHPTLPFYEAFLTYGQDGYLYTPRGNNTNEYYRYSIASNTWERIADLPAFFHYGGAGESNKYNKIFMLTGVGSNSPTDGLYEYVVKTENSAFVRNGKYTTESYSLGQVYKYGELLINQILPDNTNLSIQSSVSDDNNTWSSWTNITLISNNGNNYRYRLTSESKKYIKFRFNFVSNDGVSSPIINEMKFRYYADEIAPENPKTEGLTVVDNSNVSVNITTDTWNNIPNVRYSWVEKDNVNGAIDNINGSGIKGYYVYYGTNQNAIPSVDGIFQEQNVFNGQNMIDNSTYYLRIQTVDWAGNLSENIWAPFIYKYDASGPSSISNLTVDPAGYTATNSFNFSWDYSTTTGAPISQYCYKTGATSGDYSVEQCINNNEIASIPSYRVGTNIFYVRAKDLAGNYSSQASVNYFFVNSDNAPAPPTNLQVTPTNSTSNSFAFRWDPPAVGTYYGSVSNMSYLYSVNALPTAYSTSATSLTYLNAGAFATLPGENIFYIVSKDEAGNVNYSNYASISFFANTVAPGLPLNVEIADVSVKSTESWRLAISWDQPLDEGSGVAGYQIYRSIDGDNFTFHSYTSGNSLVDTRLIQQMYYYKVKACDSTNNCGGFSSTVNFLPDGRYTEPADLLVAPFIVESTSKRAKISWITSRTADSKIAYGIEPGVYYETEVSNSDQVLDHTLSINNLKPGTKYYYVAKWTDEDGNTGISEELTFETAPPPTVGEPKAKRVGLNNALIEFKTKGSSRAQVLYGETVTFGAIKEIFTGTDEGTHYVELPDLKDGTKYFFRIDTFDSDGAQYEGETHSFETLPKPKVSAVKIYQVTGTASTTLLIEWETNTPTSSIVTYYPVNNPAQAKDEVNVALKKGKHRMILLKLEPNAQYNILVRGKDFMGNEANAGSRIFKTASDTRPPQLYDLEVSTEIIGSGEQATAQFIVSYKTDEMSTSQVEYGEGTGTMYTQKTQEDTTKSLNHLVIISGLTPGKVYHLRALSKDDAGNLGYSIDKVVVAPVAAENALNIAIKNLTSIFSFMNK